MKITNDLTIDGNLKIVQDSNFCKYTIDSVLLSNFVKIKKNTKNIVDLCGGEWACINAFNKKKSNKPIKDIFG